MQRLLPPSPALSPRSAPRLLGSLRQQQQLLMVALALSAADGPRLPLPLSMLDFLPASQLGL
jgi:hypothetical protein